MSDKQADIETLAAESQACHAQLDEQRQRIDAAYDLFSRSAAAYYTMCRIEGQEADRTSHEAVIALSEFRRLGVLQFNEKTVAKLSAAYVRSMKILKQTVDQAVALCERLEQLTKMEQQLHQAPAEETEPIPDTLAQAIADLEAEDTNA